MKTKILMSFLIGLLLIGFVFAEVVSPIDIDADEIVAMKGDKSFSYYTWVFDQNQRYYLFQDGDHFLDVPGDNSFPNTFNPQFYADSSTFAKGYTSVDMDKTKFYTGKTKFVNSNKLNLNPNQHSATHFRTYVYLNEGETFAFNTKHDDGLKVYVWNCGDEIFNEENCKRTTVYDEVFAVKEFTPNENLLLKLEKGWNVIDFRHFNDYRTSYLYVDHKGSPSFISAFNNNLKFMSSSKPTNSDMCNLGLLGDDCIVDPEPEPTPVPTPTPVPPNPEPRPMPEPTPIPVPKPVIPVPEPQPNPVVGRPVCSHIGTDNEGWYFKGELIKEEICSCKAVCRYEETKSEGYYNSCNNIIIKYVDCDNSQEVLPIKEPILVDEVKQKPLEKEISPKVTVKTRNLINNSKTINTKEEINLSIVKESMIASKYFEEVEDIKVTDIDGEDSVVVTGTVNKGFWIFNRNVPKTMVLTRENATSLK